MPDCIFCKIIAGEIPCTKVYEDEKTFAFLSTGANNHGHALVVPKKHCRNLLDMDKETVVSLALAVQKVAKGVFKGVKAKGVNTLMNNEKYAGQAVFHAHVHVIPRFTNDGLLNWNKNVSYADGEAKTTAENIQKAITN
jgi:histidine triad (HIT) family protein